MGFAEFSALVVEVLGGGDVVEEGPSLSGSDERWGEDDSVERYVVFAHELVKFDLFIVLPPSLIVLLE